MNIDIIAIISILFGSGGIAYGVFYWRENKAMKKNEVKSLQYQAESTYIDNMDKAMDVYKEAIEFQKAQTDEIEKFHTLRYDRIAETLQLYKEQVEEFKKDSHQNRIQLRELSKKIQGLEKKINDDKHLICHNMLCAIRQSEKI